MHAIADALPALCRHLRGSAYLGPSTSRVPHWARRWRTYAGRHDVWAAGRSVSSLRTWATLVFIKSALGTLSSSPCLVSLPPAPTQLTLRRGVGMPLFTAARLRRARFARRTGRLPSAFAVRGYRSARQEGIVSRLAYISRKKKRRLAKRHALRSMRTIASEKHVAPAVGQFFGSFAYARNNRHLARPSGGCLLRLLLSLPGSRCSKRRRALRSNAPHFARPFRFGVYLQPAGGCRKAAAGRGREDGIVLALVRLPSTMPLFSVVYRFLLLLSVMNPLLSIHPRYHALFHSAAFHCAAGSIKLVERGAVHAISSSV